MKIILSTRNPSKVDQIKAIIDNPLIIVKTLEEVGIEGEAIEDGDTLEENAFKKAKFASEQSEFLFWTMADDTGIFIKALNGEPGVKSARWAGEVPTEEITQYCLKRLTGIKDRNAYFETVVVLIPPKPLTGKYIFSGRVNGYLLDAPRTKPQPKMPYSPLFIPEGSEKCWAEMTIAEENVISHRGKAFRKVAEFLEGL
jgi:XTP/dITP diphosphohydrolase